MKQNIEAAIPMRPMALSASKNWQKHLAIRIVSLLAGLANVNHSHHSERSREHSGLHERDESVYRRQLLEAKLRDSYRRIR